VSLSKHLPLFIQEKQPTAAGAQLIHQETRRLPQSVPPPPPPTTHIFGGNAKQINKLNYISSAPKRTGSGSLDTYWAAVSPRTFPPGS